MQGILTKSRPFWKHSEKNEMGNKMSISFFSSAPTFCSLAVTVQAHFNMKQECHEFTFNMKFTGMNYFWGNTSSFDLSSGVYIVLGAYVMAGPLLAQRYRPGLFLSTR